LGADAISQRSEDSPASLFVAGEFDGVVTMYRQAFDSLEETMPGLEKEGFGAGREDIRKFVCGSQP
jgi:hypothetical protein